MQYILKPLDPRQIDQAFPLIQAAIPDVVAERWRAFARALVSDGGAPADVGCPAPAGILTAQSDKGYIHGLFGYRVAGDLQYGRRLEVADLVVVDLFDVSGAAEALLEAIDFLARRLGCVAVAADLSRWWSNLPRFREAMASRLESRGFRIEGVRFSRIAPAPLVGDAPA